MKPRMPVVLTIVVSVLALGLSGANAQTVLYVDDDAPLGGDGTSWSSPYKYLQDALAAASTDPTVNEIRVAGGVYKPDRDEGGNVTAGDREATFQLLNGVAIRGGYAGYDAVEPNERNLAVFKTVLSGDLNGDDLEPPASDCCTPHEWSGCDDSTCYDAVCAWRWQCCEGEWNESCVYIALDFLCPDLCQVAAGNSYHVLTGSETDNTAVIDGFTISGGNADGLGYPQYTDRGGGMLLLDGNPTIRNCLFLSNTALGLGGALFISQDGSAKPASPLLHKCTFRGNYAGDRGGGAFIRDSDPHWTQCVFEDNSAWVSGGGLYNLRSNGVITGSVFLNNFIPIEGSGGGMYNDFSSPFVSDCTFVGNTALDGGGVRNHRSYPVLIDCSFARNNRWALSSRHYSHADLIRSVFARNSLVLDARTAGTILAVNCMLVDNDGTVVISQGGQSHITLSHCTIVQNTGTGVKVDSSSVTVTDCILWENTVELELISASPVADVTYTCIQGGWPGVGNIAADPVFVPGPAGLYYLSQVAAGQAVDSPCVDAGSDLAANLGLDKMTTRSDDITDGSMVDMGYHYPVRGDFDRDGDTDMMDVLGFQACFTGGDLANVSPLCRVFDVESDGDVDLADYAEFIEVFWGPESVLSRPTRAPHRWARGSPG